MKYNDKKITITDYVLNGPLLNGGGWSLDCWKTGEN